MKFLICEGVYRNILRGNLYMNELIFIWGSIVYYIRY